MLNPGTYYKKLVSVCFLVIICNNLLVAQFGLPDSSENHKHFLVLPTLSRSNETGFEFGVGGLVTFSLAKNKEQTRTSQLQGAVLYTQDKQFLTGIAGTQFLTSDKYIINEEISFRNYFEDFWGIGSNSPDSAEEPYNYQQYYLFVDAQRKVGKYFYVGARLQLLDITKFSYAPNGIFDKENVAGESPYKIAGLGASFTYDSRNDAFASTAGAFLQAYFMQYDAWWGSDYQFSTLVLDARKYLSINKTNVLAFQGYFMGNYGNAIPMRSMATFGGSNNMRGFYKGRYRDNDVAYYQSEWRITLKHQFGLVFFGGLGDVQGDLSKYNLGDLKYSAGGGVRYTLHKNERLNFRLDVAIGTGGNEGYYLQVGEAF